MISLENSPVSFGGWDMKKIFKSIQHSLPVFGDKDKMFRSEGIINVNGVKPMLVSI